MFLVKLNLVYLLAICCRLLMSSEELRLFDKIRVFLDEDYSSAEHFTVGKIQKLCIYKIYIIIYVLSSNYT